jgi:hypothetical protein
MEEWTARAERVSEWYGPARFGLFYHWGLYTGGGSSEAGRFNGPLRYGSVAEFEAAAADPQAIARNMVGLAQEVGARYITFTLLHSCDRFTVMYPTRVSAFLSKTNQDYVGALVDACYAAKVRLMLYMPASAGDHAMTEGGPWIPEGYRENRAFIGALQKLVVEFAERYGDKLAGFWLDGLFGQDYGHELPDFMHSLLPQAIVTVNNLTSHDIPGVDIGTTEFTSTPPDPIYNRPSGLLRPHPRWPIQPPKRDYNEDIPTCNNWWHGSPYQTEEELRAGPYVQDPTFWVKQMVSSLGQRGQWNHALGIGPTIEGRAPAMFQPTVEAMSRFMAWAKDAIYETTGGEGAGLQQGWWNDGAFGSITVPLYEGDTLFLHVTTAPSSNHLMVQNNRGPVAEVVDLHTGRRLPFINRGALHILEMDWADVADYGAKVLRVTFAEDGFYDGGAEDGWEPEG